MSKRACTPDSNAYDTKSSYVKASTSHMSQPPHLTPVSPHESVNPAQFTDQKQRMFLLFFLREHLPDNYQCAAFLLDQSCCSLSCFYGLLQTLRERAYDHEYFLMALSVLAEALTGTPSPPSESADSLCKTICARLGEKVSVESLCAVRGLSSVSALFLGLFDPSMYATVFKAFGVPDIECMPPISNSELEEELWYGTCVTVSAQLRDVFSGRLTPICVSAMRSVMRAGHLHPDDAARLVHTLQPPRPVATPSEAITFLDDYYYLSRLPRLLSADAMLGTCSAPLLRPC